MVRKKVLSIALAAMMTTGTILGDNSALYQSIFVKAKTTTDTEVTVDEKQVDANEYGLVDNIQDGTILHCFDWKYNDIKAELKNIADAGFTSVQTSPAQRDDSYGVWYMLYQPQSFSIATNALGSKEDLQSLCTEAEKYGIKVIVDVVANHMRGDGNNVDDNMKRSNHPDYWHTDDYDSGRNIDWKNRFQVTHGRIGMQDLNSENSSVQNIVANYVKELASVGVDGIRWDAAKHISLPSENCNFWKVVTEAAGLYNYGEILGGPTDDTSSESAKSLMKEYTNYMSVTDNSYGSDLCGSFRDGKITGTSGIWTNKGVSADKLVYWGESHDTYANDEGDGGWTKNISQNAVDRAYAIAAGRADATSLYFSRPSATAKTSIMAGAKGSTHFTSKEVAAVNHLHNACVGQKDYYVAGSDAAAVCRETGAVIVKGSGSGQVTIQNGGGLTAPGTYTDEVSGSTWTVTADTISGTVGDSGIAVIYNGAKKPTVSVSKDSGTFTEPFELTLTPSNVDKATYSINGGDAVEFTKATKVKIGEGCQIGDKVTVKITATGEGESFEKTLTYTMTDVPVAKFLVRAKKSDFTSAPYIYAFSSGATAKEYAGKWPGTKMTEEGDYYVFSSDDMDSATVILSDGNNGWRNTQEGETEVVVNGMMEYDKSSNKFTTITIASKTPSPTTVVTPTPKITETPKVTETPKITETPKATVNPTPTATAESKVSIDVSLDSGSSFTTESKDVKVTLKNATSGTYRVDNGPVKTFTGSATVTIGQGKIADTDVTLEVTAISGKNELTKTFTYHKVFDGTTAQVKTAAVTKIQSLFEVVAEAAQANTAAESDAYYATNPGSKVGKKASIKIDGSFSDWSDDMLIAQGAAFDTATAFKGQWENCVMDSYSLYGAWDDENLYIGFQLVNVYDDALKDSGMDLAGGPLSCNGKIGDLPITIAINTGKGNAMTGRVSDGKGIWGQEIEFKTRVDNILVFHGDNTGTPGFFTGTEDGTTNYKANCQNFKELGIEVESADGCLPKTIMGVKDNQGDVQASYSMDSAWIDFNTTTHDNKYDTFYEVKIPFSALGITASDVENNGVGVMQLIGRGESGMDCIPHDPSMLDNTMGDYAAQPTNSHEKDDTDIITVPLAAIGNMKATGEGSGGNVSTPKPSTATTEPQKTEVVKTPAATEKATPKATTPAQTIKPTAKVTATPVQTKKPATAEPVATSNPGKKFTVNFGADRSSPQYDSTKLVLKAIPYGASGDCKYEFLVDGETVQKASKNATYTWNGTEGKHTIKVVVEDASGNKISSEKQYVIEHSGTATPVVKPTATASIEDPKNTATPGVEETAQPLSARIKLSAASPQKVGKRVTLQLIANGGTAPYKYSVTATKSNGKKTTLLKNSNKSTVVWTPANAGTYKLTATIEDANGVKAVKNVTYTIKAVSPIKVKTFKVSKYSIARGKSVKITVKATSSNKGKVKYKISVQKKGDAKKTVVRKYSTKTTYTWKASKKGKYTIYVTVRDAKGKTTTKKLRKQITVK